jgi:hypothetical protein
MSQIGDNIVRPGGRTPMQAGGEPPAAGALHERDAGIREQCPGVEVVASNRRTGGAPAAFNSAVWLGGTPEFLHLRNLLIRPACFLRTCSRVDGVPVTRSANCLKTARSDRPVNTDNGIRTW